MDSVAGRRFVVIGAYVVDCIARTSELPAWESATLAESITLVPGGKALNQAIALSRLGADVQALGVVGRDPAGGIVIEALERNRVDTTLIRCQDNANTPVCMCFANNSGETSFLWRISEETAITPTDIDRAENELASADAVLMTYELPLDTARHALSTLRSSSATVVVQPSPPLADAHTLPYDGVDALLPNLAEARALLAGRQSAATSSPSDVPVMLHKATGVPRIIVTCGADGCHAFADSMAGHFPAHPVPQVVDTTGASDAFAAYFAASTVSGSPIETAINDALAAAAHSIQRAGGSASMPPGPGL
ncbi:ribokinase [Nocardia sp. MDA0666]|uniref:carbohydrate kinase family protein n=1 Tax=Nocardia sp. MDA0666 TaxID=2135448 RepID=UPI000D120F3D|nr:PfkB family carbohydrate kinase [Nocardia sp. MDA0666]PSR62129.1 ribokinase [Nocardia sp. MDA0666]